MAKIAILGMLLLSACGRSECQDYTTVFCTKAIGCDVPPGAATYPQAECESGLKRTLEAQRTTEAECKKAREKIVSMTCTQ